MEGGESGRDFIFIHDHHRIIDSIDAFSNVLLSSPSSTSAQANHNNENHNVFSLLSHPLGSTLATDINNNNAIAGNNNTMEMGFINCHIEEDEQVDDDVDHHLFGVDDDDDRELNVWENIYKHQVSCNCVKVFTESSLCPSL